MINNIKIYEEDINRVIINNSFNNLKNATILVVGANGLIGSAIIDVLNYLNKVCNSNIKIIGTVRNINKKPERFNSYTDLEIIEYDVMNNLNLGKNIDYIINAASNANPIKFSTDPVGTLLSNFIGTKNLLDYAKDNKCERLLYISSGEVYGQCSDNVLSFDESYTGSIKYVNSRSCYPIGKISSENLCSCYHDQYGIDTVIARLCHTYGPTQTNEDSRVSAQFINNVLNDNDIVLKSTGSQIRSYCYVIDSVCGILTILNKGKNGEVYNVANNKSIISIRNMAEVIARYCNKKVIFELPDDIEKKGYNPVTRSVLDGSKLESIGWIPQFDFEEGIIHTIKIMKK